MGKRQAKEILAIVVGGGPAPGINGVISAATIEAVNEGKRVIGIVGGFRSLFRGDRRAAVSLGIKDVSRIHGKGGSILKTLRDFPEDHDSSFRTLMDTLAALRVRYLLTIGGDGTLYMANRIERAAKGDISVIHVPKTIDNDINLPGGMPTFGFETARHWGAEILENITEDARTTERWYFVTTMGRQAGHLALGIGKAVGATLTVVPEEFRGRAVCLQDVADILEGSIIKRLSHGKNYGVAVLAEGIAGRLDMEELSRFEHLERDEIGRVRLSKIKLGAILKDMVVDSLRQRGIDMTIVDKRIGYELRCADPVPFDVEYTRNLGFGAVKHFLLGGTGSMVTFYEGRLKAVPFAEMTDPLTGKPHIRYVDISSETYCVGREYMIRLEKADLEGAALARLARAARMTPSALKRRFSRLFEGEG